MTGPCVGVSAARALIDDNPNVLIVDVRTPGEFASAHISGAVNLPLDQVNAHLRRIVADAGGTMLLICQSGNRASQACAALSEAGLSDAMVLEGGMNAWTAAGAPTVATAVRPRWALERQVRLVAGSIVFVSVVAGFWWHPITIIAGLIGAGLTFAAISNTCAMGMMLAKLPYNQGERFDIDAAIARLSAARVQA